ncbi:hypothetical protein [Photobacterium leiognathi]|uniref:hypothetical protein n=1 Tax=Photobacterium leiognathi TaxID=553611 RepID=UPI002982928E|nr:hypothetical protein [Photobacterium leiognathi]
MLKSSSVIIKDKFLLLSLIKNSTNILKDDKHSLFIDPISKTAFKYSESSNLFIILDRVALDSEMQSSHLVDADYNTDIETFISTSPERFIAPKPQSYAKSLAEWQGSPQTFILSHDCFDEPDAQQHLVPPFTDEHIISLQKIFADFDTNLLTNKLIEFLNLSSTDLSAEIENYNLTLHNNLLLLLNKLNQPERANKLKSTYDSIYKEWFNSHLQNETDILIDYIKPYITSRLQVN